MDLKKKKLNLKKVKNKINTDLNNQCFTIKKIKKIDFNLKICYIYVKNRRD